MATTQTGPGVYIQEEDFSDYIAALGTTSVGMVGTATKGPIGEPRFISSVEQYIATYGAPTLNQYGPYAAINYLREGQQLWYQRVARRFQQATTVATGTVNSTSLVVASGTGIAIGNYVIVQQSGRLSSFSLVTNKSSNTLTLETGLADTYTTAANVLVCTDIGALAAEAIALGIPASAHTTSSRIVLFRAINEGSWSTYGAQLGLEVIVEDSGQFANINPVTNAPYTNTDGVDLSGIQPNAPSVNTHYDLLQVTGMVDGQTRGVNDSRRCVQITALTLASTTITADVADADQYFASGDSVVIRGAATSGNNGTFTLTSVTSSTIVFTNASGATEASPAAAFVTNASGNATALVWRYDSGDEEWSPIGTLTKRVRVLYQGRQVEVFDNIIAYDDEHANFWETVIGTVANPVSNYITCEYVATASGAQPANTYNRSKHPDNVRILFGQTTTFNGSTYNPVGGRDGNNAEDSDFIGTIVGNVHYGLQAFRRKEVYELNVLCAPGQSSAEVVQEGASIAQTRSDCMFILDPPFGLSLQEALDWHNGSGIYTGNNVVTTNCAAGYWPWVKQADPYNGGKGVWLPPSAFIPNVWAYSDRVGEAWYAPAGVNRGKVRGAVAVEYAVSQGDIAEMYGPGNGNALNPIAVFPQDGILVYGQRTMQRTPTALDRVNVRRLLFYIEKTVAAMSRRLQFEQNDPILWAQFRNSVNPFLAGLLGRRALEWYQVVCDVTTNTAEMRNNNEVGAKIYLIPTKSAEKVMLNFTLLPSGANVSEIIVSGSLDNNVIDQSV